MIREIIVVEGKSDTAAIARSVEAETIETGGSAINDAILETIRLAQQRRGVIIFTDPDHPGEKIRRTIMERVPGCKHAFLTQDEARGKRNLGIENASSEAIRSALRDVRTEWAGAVAQIGLDDLLEAGLIGHPQAARRRAIVSELLKIGHCNGKQFWKRCAMFQITRDEFLQALRQMEASSGGGVEA